MARRRIRRIRRRTRWSANIQELNNNTIDADPSSLFSGTATLATNPSQTTLGVSQVYTVKNFDINFTIETVDAQFIEMVTAYIMYVPQGMNVSENYNLDHPEYILNYKYLGSPNPTGNTETQQFQPIRVRSKLSRKLQTGDSIVLFVKGYNQKNTGTTVSLSGLIRWWTKSN